MNNLQIITPVKDSLSTILQTIESVMNSEISVNFSYTVYNDFSTDETTEKLEAASKKLGFNLVNLKDATMHPSPNYLLVLQIAQQKAIFDEAHILIIESDVIVKKNTIQQMYDSVANLEKPGLVSAITTDSNGRVNYPYLFARNNKSKFINTKKQLSFCCTIIAHPFLASYNFDALNPERTWHDHFISQKSLELGFKNYLITTLPVVHLQHSIYPWKHLKSTQPMKYYWKKFIGKFSNN